MCEVGGGELWVDVGVECVDRGLRLDLFDLFVFVDHVVFVVVD